VIFRGNVILIRASVVNDSNRGLLTNTLRRQGKKWELTTVDGEGFLKVEDKEAGDGMPRGINSRRKTPLSGKET